MGRKPGIASASPRASHGRLSVYLEHRPQVRARFCFLSISIQILPHRCRIHLQSFRSLFNNLVFDRPVLSRSYSSRALLPSLHSLSIASATSLTTNNLLHFSPLQKSALSTSVVKASTPIDIRSAFFKDRSDSLAQSLGSI